MKKLQEHIRLMSDERKCVIALILVLFMGLLLVYTAAVELGVRYIRQKTYGDITFPAGNYEALNITIGSGQGENWWCVLFPPLCLLDEGTAPISGDDTDSDPAKAAADGSSSSGGSGQSSVQDSVSAASSVHNDALTKEQKLKLRWKTLELLKGN